MKFLIIEGEEPLIHSTKADHEQEEKYVFKGNIEERKSLLELTVELRNNSSMRVLILANSKYFSHTNAKAIWYNIYVNELVKKWKNSENLMVCQDCAQLI